MPYYREFGSWNEALNAAGLLTNHRNDVPDEELIDELRRVATTLDRTPRFEDVEEYGMFSASTYMRRWGSWPDAKEAAGLRRETRTSRRIERSELLDALDELAREVGKAPTQEEMNELGRFSQRPYYREWGSWAEALRAGGFEPNHENGYNEDELVDALRELADELGHTPARWEMDEKGEFSSDPYIRAFGTWTEAWDAAGLEPRAWYPKRATERELIESIHALAEELDRVPTRQEMVEHGPYSREPFLRTFGSWSAALEAAGFEPYRHDDTDSEYIYYGSNWPDQRKKALLRDQYRCQRCGVTEPKYRRKHGRGLEVHHLTKLRKFDNIEVANQLSNLLTLCPEDHRLVEAKGRVTKD